MSNTSFRLMHKPTGQTGTFVKSYEVTGRGSITQIKLADGGIYYAPSSEFKVL